MSAQADLFGGVTQAADHRCLGCGETHAGARDVTLVDGTVVSNYSEAWRIECEARSILDTPGIERRQRRLATIEKRRGAETAEHLRDIMLAIWGKSKGAFGPQKNAA